MSVAKASQARTSEAPSSDEASQSFYDNSVEVRTGTSDTYAYADNEYSKEKKIHVMLKGKPHNNNRSMFFGCPAFEILSPGEVAVCDTGKKLVRARFFWREKLFGNVWRWRWSKRIKSPQGMYIFDAVLKFEDGDKPRVEPAFRDLPV